MKICAGIVSYNPDLLVIEKNLIAIYPQVDKVFLVDNGSLNIKDLERIFSEFNNIEIIRNEENKGIAFALNQLCSYAYKQKFDCIITLDQDSLCSQNFVKELIVYYNDSIGIVCPRIDFIYDDNYCVSTTSPEGQKITACITSGSLTSLLAWKKCSGFDNWMFIDHVDDDFCMRLKLAGFYIVRANKAILYQRAGEMDYRRFPFGKRIRLFGYSPFRVYYITRNTLYYIKKYRKNVNILKECVKFIYCSFRMFIFEKNRFKVIPSFIKGFRDGLLKRVEHI